MKRSGIWKKVKVSVDPETPCDQGMCLNGPVGAQFSTWSGVEVPATPPPFGTVIEPGEN